MSNELEKWLKYYGQFKYQENGYQQELVREDDTDWFTFNDGKLICDFINARQKQVKQLMEHVIKLEKVHCKVEQQKLELNSEVKQLKADYMEESTITHELIKKNIELKAENEVRAEQIKALIFFTDALMCEVQDSGHFGQSFVDELSKKYENIGNGEILMKAITDE